MFVDSFSSSQDILLSESFIHFFCEYFFAFYVVFIDYFSCGKGRPVSKSFTNLFSEDFFAFSEAFLIQSNQGKRDYSLKHCPIFIVPISLKYLKFFLIPFVIMFLLCIGMPSFPGVGWKCWFDGSKLEYCT